MGKKPKAPPAPPPPGRFHAPFEGLRERLGLPEAPAGPAPDAPPADPAAAADARRAPARAADARPAPARAVVRLERKGRGGKAVTVVERLGLHPADLEAWLAELRRALGCGGSVEGDALVLQGDLRERVRGLLEACGVRRVTVA